MKVIVSSQNPVKVRAARQAFSRVFPSCQIIGVQVDSGVSDQPNSESEMKKGALQRVRNAQKAYPRADFWVGMEGGAHLQKKETFSFAWMCIENKKGKQGWGRTASFQLPQKAVGGIRKGKELGTAMDELFDTTKSKQKGGAIGLLSEGALPRAKLYEQGLICALVPFIHTKLF